MIDHVHRPTRNPTGAPTATATSTRIVACQRAVAATWRRGVAKRAEYREIPPATSHHRHEEMRDRRQPDEGQQRSQHPRKLPHSRQIGDLVGGAGRLYADRAYG